MSCILIVVLLAAPTCAGQLRIETRASGLVLSELAAGLFVSGRLAEAEATAERALNVLQTSHSPSDPALLRPLQILTSVRFEQGRFAKAREAFRRIQSLRIERPEDRALAHSMAAALLQVEGRRKEAEVEYFLAAKAWTDSGRGETAEAAAVLNGLGALYIEEKRFEDAGRALDRAFAIFDKDEHTVPMDRVKLLNVRAALHARQSQWADSADDLYRAISMADRETTVNPAFLAQLLSSYGAVLRKSHRRREARAIEARANELAKNSASGVVVDVTELLAKSRLSKK